MKNNFKLLYNPFNQIAGWKAFFIGTVVVIATVIVGHYSSVVYPGALDAKLAANITLIKAFLYQLIGLSSLILIFYLSALLFAKGTRFQDIAGTVTFARYPYLFIAILGFFVSDNTLIDVSAALKSGNLYEMSQVFPKAISFMVVSLLMIPFVIWFIALLYNAFRVSTGLKGVKCALVFTASLIIAEIVSLIIIALVVL